MSEENECNQGVDITPNKDGGVLKEILKPGNLDETPSAGYKVTVHYTGTLAEDGSQFDSSRDRGEKFTFTLGKGEVIKAWDIGVASMRKGELAKLTCRGDYAYGASGSPPNIPPNATLNFEVELFDWKEEDLSNQEDGGILRRTLVNGEGFRSPLDGAEVQLKLKGTVNGTIFDDREVKFAVGEGIDLDIPRGVEKAIKKFKNKEKSIIKLTPAYGFGEAGNEKLKVPGNAPLEYELELLSFEKTKKPYEMDQQERLEQARISKEKGTKYFKEGKYKLAIKLYKRIIECLEITTNFTEEELKEVSNLVLAGHLNLAMCHLKVNDSNSAKDSADKALEKDPDNVKAHFRKGSALLNIREYELAIKSFQTSLKLDPSNKSAANQIKICQNFIKEQKQKDKQLYKGMFDKFAKSDAKKNAANNRNGNVMTGDLGEWDTNKKPSENTDEWDDTDFNNLCMNNIELINSGGVIPTSPKSKK